MAETNHFKIIYDRLKVLLENSEYTKHINVFGGEKTFKKKYPIMFLLPAGIQQQKPEGSKGRRRKTPYEEWFGFKVLLLVRVTNDATQPFGKKGITQQWAQLKALLLNDVTLNGACADIDWTDLVFHLEDEGGLDIAEFLLLCRRTDIL